ncbi:MAG: ParA family protein [Acidobacteria bacterium]|nr:ParA family protein [Acidobacteriota bacterium]
MNAPLIAFFNNRVAAGKSTLVYHLAWMYADLGVPVLVADLDPQARLTATFVDDEALEEVWGADPPCTRFQVIGEGLALLPSGIHLSMLDEPGIRNRLDLVRSAAETRQAGIVLMNLGPGFDPLNRAALLAADHVLVPLPPDRQSLATLAVLGDAFQAMPEPVRLLGYILLRRSVRLGQPMSTQLWSAIQLLMSGPEWFATIREYPGLLSLAHEARRPTFQLKPGDGAMASLLKAAQDTGKEYRTLALAIASRAKLELPIEPSPARISS